MLILKYRVRNIGGMMAIVRTGGQMSLKSLKMKQVEVQKAMDEGDVIEAAEMHLRLARSSPDNIVAAEQFEMAGRTFDYAGDTKSAIECYDKAVGKYDKQIDLVRSGVEEVRLSVEDMLKRRDEVAALKDRRHR